MGDSDGFVKIFDINKRVITANLCLNKGIAIWSLNFSKDCKLLAVGDSEGIVRTL